MGRWAAQNGLVVPDDAYFANMTHDLAVKLAEVTEGPVQIITQKEMFDGMDKLVSESPYPVVSLDRAYFDADHPTIAGFVDVTRAVQETTDENGVKSFESIEGLTPRPGAPSVEEQVARLKETLGSTPVTLVDDVVFSGETPAMVVEALEAAGIPVARFITGIGIKEGVERLTALGVEVVCVKAYDDVADEVCERDFLAGVPMSGRTVVGEDGTHWSAPYVEPYGNTKKWASIPDAGARALSQFCLGQSFDLWRKVEELNGQLIPSHMVPRPLKDARSDQSIVDRIWHDYFNY